MSISSMGTAMGMHASGTAAAAGDGAAYALSWASITDLKFGATATAYFRIQRDGDVTLSGATPGADDWRQPRSATVGDAYEVKVTKNSGTTPTGDSLGVWLALSSDRQWTYTQTTSGSKTGNFTLEIRKGGVVKVSNTFSMTAQRF